MSEGPNKRVTFAVPDDEAEATSSSPSSSPPNHEGVVTDEHPPPFAVASSASVRRRIENNNRQHLVIEESATGSKWELTWPIWHMLPRHERKDIALRHGMRSIGEFEEYMSLQRAVGMSSDATVVADRDEYVTVTRMEDVPVQEGMHAAVGKDDQGGSQGDDEDYEDEEDDGAGVVSDDADMGQSNGASTTTGDDEAESSEDGNDGAAAGDGGLLASLLPDEIHHRIMSYLDVHSYGTCALVHPTWHTFTRTERAYKIMCQRSYLNQSRRKVLSLSRWRTYHNMLTNRPRVRTGGGVYVLKYAQVKKIQRDMWTEVPVGAVLETVYYRYLIFHENGTCMYALTPSPPHEMIPRFVAVTRKEEVVDDGRVVLGRYEIGRDVVRVRARHSWCHVAMEMKVLTGTMDGFVEEGNGGSGAQWGAGRFTTMKFQRHRSCSDGNFDDDGNNFGSVVEYEVPDELFRFLRDKRL